MADEKKDTILVLPKHFFVNAFIAERGSDTITDYVEQNHYRFIANVIIEVSASFPEYKSMVVTTSTAISEFDQLLSRRQLSLGSDEILRILKEIIYVVDTPSINKLSAYESMIAIADKLYVSSAYEPVVVINPNSRENYKEAAKNYYGNHGGYEKDSLPFKIYDPRQTKAFLETIFPNESAMTIKRTPQPFCVFD